MNYISIYENFDSDNELGRSFIHKERDSKTGKLQFVIFAEEINLLKRNEEIPVNSVLSAQELLTLIGGESYNLRIEVWPDVFCFYPEVEDWLKRHRKRYSEPEIEVPPFNPIKLKELAKLIKNQPNNYLYYFPDFMLEGNGFYSEFNFDFFCERLKYGGDFSDFVFSFVSPGINEINRFNPWLKNMLSKYLDLILNNIEFNTFQNSLEIVRTFRSIPNEIILFLIDNDSQTSEYLVNEDHESINIIVRDKSKLYSHVIEINK